MCKQHGMRLAVAKYELVDAIRVCSTKLE